jgi:hypothetical protein
MDWEAEGTVRGENFNIRIAKRGEDHACAGGKGRMAFDGENLSGEFGEESGDVSGTGADFENGIGRRELERLKHDGDNVGLGDGLGIADGERMILVGFGTERLRDEFVAGNTQHGVEDAWIDDTASPELGVDHLLAGGGH